jgi:hypothetical protein
MMTTVCDINARCLELQKAAIDKYMDERIRALFKGIADYQGDKKYLFSDDARFICFALWWIALPLFWCRSRASRTSPSPTSARGRYVSLPDE